MVIDDVDFRRSRVGPSEDDTPLVVNTNTMKSSQIMLQGFQPISRRRPQVVELMGIVEHVELPQSDLGHPGPSSLWGSDAIDEKVLEVVLGDALDGHRQPQYAFVRDLSVNLTV